MPASSDTATSPTSLIRLRDRREEVLQLLTDNYANDVLSLELFEERLSLAHQAATVAALDQLVADLEPLPPSAARIELTTLAPDTIAVPSARSSKISAIFSSVERRGAWSVPSQLRVSSVFGNAELDLRQARFAPGVTEIRLNVVFGNVEILVPPHLAVECEGTAIFASFEQGGGAVADPDRPILRITGRAIFGNVEIKARPPGEKWRDPHHRRQLPAPSDLSGPTAPALPPHSPHDEG